jgi:hypothetical protein
VGLPCLNCGRPVPLDGAKIFAECFLCSDCHTIAERLFLQGNNELEHLKLVLKELIRGAITRKQLALPPPSEKDGDGQLCQPRAIELLIQMMKGPACTSPPKSTSVPPKLSTSAAAPTPDVDGQPSSNSSPEQPSSPETLSTGTPATEPSDNA